MLKNNGGFALIEALVAFGIALLSVGFYIDYYQQTTHISTGIKSHLQAVSVMQNVYQDINAASSSSFAAGGMTIYYDQNGVPAVLPSFYTVTMNYGPYALMNNFNEIVCDIQWTDNNQPNVIHFHVIK